MEITNNSEKVINEHILEIRFTPNPKLLDYRGSFSEQIGILMGLPHWKIDTNRVDIFDDNETRKFFLSFRNFGSIIRNSDTKNYFSDQSVKFAKFLLDKKEFGTPIIDRIGVRSRFCVLYDGTYEELLQQFATHYITVNPELANAIEGKIFDLNFPINFKTPNGSINTNVGPINNEQFKGYFPFSSIDLQTGIFIDLDYWKTPKETFNQNVLKAVKKYGESNWEIAQKIVDILV